MKIFSYIHFYQILDNGFENLTNLQKVTLPTHLEIIGGNAFNRCTSLMEITLPQGLEEIKTYAFSKCSSLSKINVPKSVKLIEPYAFAEAGLTSMIIDFTLNWTISDIYYKSNGYDGAASYCDAKNNGTADLNFYNYSTGTGPSALTMLQSRLAKFMISTPEVGGEGLNVSPYNYYGGASTWIQN